MADDWVPLKQFRQDLGPQRLGQPIGEWRLDFLVEDLRGRGLIEVSVRRGLFADHHQTIPLHQLNHFFYDEVQDTLVHKPTGEILYDPRVRRASPPELTRDAAPPEASEAHPVFTTGAPGKPSSMHLIEGEFDRRAKAGMLAEKGLAEEARQLRQWLRDTHPTAPPPTHKTIENRLRGQYWQRKQNPPIL